MTTSCLVARGASKNNERGFTLVEIMIAIVIGALLVTLAIPSLRGMIQNANITRATNSLVSSLNLARMEAIKGQYEVALCPAAGVVPDTGNPAAAPDGDACELTSSVWNDGYMVVKGIAPTAAELAADPTLNANTPVSYAPMRVFSDVPTSVVSMTNSTSDQAIAFDRRGSLIASTSAQFAICDDRGPAFGRYVLVSRNGRVSTSSFAATTDTACTLTVIP